MDEVLVAEDVRKHYGDTVALAGVSVSTTAGEVLVLVGPNGAGKTTLVRTLTGTTVPDEGTVRVLDDPPADVDRAAMGVLPQAFSPPDRLTARELLGYYAGLYDGARDPEAVLDEVGLADAGDTRYGALSGGQQRRVCLGAALVNDPSVLLLDEPTTGIDPAGRRTVRERIEALADGGATVLVTTHDMDEAERLADRVALLADGSLRATGTPAGLVEAYGGPPRVRLQPSSTSPTRAIESLEADDFDVRERDGSVVVDDVRPEGIADVVAVLEDAEVTYEGLEWRRPTLEDAYMTLAGDRATDQEASAVGDSPHDDASNAEDTDTDAATVGDDGPSDVGGNQEASGTSESATTDGTIGEHAAEGDRP